MTDFVTLPLLEWLDIPAGHVTLLNDIGEFDVQPFRIAKYAVTNAQYDAFIADGGYTDPRWWVDSAVTTLNDEQLENGMSTWQTARDLFTTPQPSTWPEPDCPRTDICWYEATAFCRWLAAKTGLPVRLPTEQEWQWAAVGASGGDYPYGAAFDAALCNTHESGIGRTVPVTAYADIPTVFGTVNQSGNTLEWCRSEFENPPNLLAEGTGRPAMRGGSWGHDQYNGRGIHRFGFNALNSSYAVGFRVACDAR